MLGKFPRADRWHHALLSMKPLEGVKLEPKASKSVYPEVFLICSGCQPTRNRARAEAYLGNVRKGVE